MKPEEEMEQRDFWFLPQENVNNYGDRLVSKSLQVLCVRRGCNMYNIKHICLTGKYIGIEQLEKEIIIANICLKNTICV